LEETDPEALKALRRGWCLSSDASIARCCCGWTVAWANIIPKSGSEQLIFTAGDFIFFAAEQMALVI
jgi:hypothetical protein